MLQKIVVVQEMMCQIILTYVYHVYSGCIFIYFIVN